MAKLLFFAGNLCWNYWVILGVITKQSKTKDRILIKRKGPSPEIMD